MRELFEKRINLILIVVVLAVAVAIGVPTFVGRPSQPASVDSVEETTATVAQTESATRKSDVVVEYSEVGVDPRSNRPAETKAQETATEAVEEKPTKATEKPEKATEETTKPTEPHIFATAAPVDYPASYDAQWDAGYLVAIDNPDTSYSVTHVELSDSNRALLERLCMGEFGEGGTTGAALIAQAVRDAMNYYGIDDVAEIIRQLHYTGSTSIPASQSCKDAVTYIFDMDKSAIQHRILYMYNPKLMSEGFSDFHESQRYICTFKSVRFFDR